MNLTLKIGAFYYEVRPFDGSHSDHDGQTLFLQQIIELEEGMTPQRAQMVKWHEVLHIVFRTTGLEELIPPDKMETTLNILSYSLIQILEDNPTMRTMLDGYPPPKKGRSR
jgi:hypothetical protein